MPKHDARVEAYGTLDELNAALGVAIALDEKGLLRADVEAIQAALFRLGAELATADPSLPARLDRVTEDDVTSLEHVIDRLDEGLPPLTRFILPGGTALAANLHLARTVCRRAERRVTALAEGEAASRTLVKYLNRLADLLFVMARRANHAAGVAETTWSGPRGA